MNAAGAAAVVVFVMGAVPFGIGASAIAKRIAYSTSGVPARAVVLEAQRLWLRDFVYPVPGRRFYRLSYEFRAAGGAGVRGEDTYLQSRGLVPPGPGGPVEVYYLPDDPASSYVVDPYTLFDAVLLAGFGLLLWGGGGWYVSKRRKKLLTAPPPGS